MVDISPPPSPTPPKRASSPTGSNVPTNGQLGGSAVTQSSSSSSSSNGNVLVVGVVDSSSATRIGTSSPSVTVTTPTTPRSSSTTATNLMELIDPLLRTITSYLPQPDLMNASRTSKRMNTLIPRATTYAQRAPGTIVTVLHLRPSSKNRGDSVGRGRLQQLVQQLQQLHEDPESHSVLQRYQHATMLDCDEFTLDPRHNVSVRRGVRGQYSDLVKKIKRTGPRLEGITSLNFGVSSPCTEEIYGLITLPYLLPSLREVDFTNTVADSSIAQIFFQNCPQLEKVTFHSAIGILTRGLRDEPVALGTLTNLKELYLDEAHFYPTDLKSAMRDLVARNEEVFRFHQFRRTVLERVSLRKATYSVMGRRTAERRGHAALPQKVLLEFIQTAIPQTVLLQLIRYAPPTLRWFRSDLTPDNIQIAHDERPDIEFVS